VICRIARDAGRANDPRGKQSMEDLAEEFNKEMDAALQNKLMNWGYAVCDAAIRAHVKPADFGIDIGTPRFPFPGQY
jgi:hypothetical protein